MTVVRARARRVWDVQGYVHLLNCGCWWFDAGVKRLWPSRQSDAFPAGTYVFCSVHESVR